MSRFLLVVFSLASLVSPMASLRAQEPPNVEEVVLADPEKHLLGDLGRGKLEEEGVRFEAFTMNDFWANVKGGHNRGGGVMGNMNLILTLDTEKMGLWDGGSLVLWGIGIYGRMPSEAVGDYQFTDSIDAPNDLDPYEMYYEHSFMDGALDILAGIHDFSLEFAILDYSYTLLNSSFITPATLTQVPASFYPFTGLGTRTFVKLNERLYLLAGVYDGDPADFHDPRHEKWGINKKGGLFSIAEVGWVEEDKAKYHTKLAIGGWYDSGEFLNFYDEYVTSSYGTYLIGEQELWREHMDDPEQGLGVFGQVGQAENAVNINPWYFGAGVRYKGLLKGRDEDVLAVGYAHAQMSKKYQEYVGSSEHSERAWELSYRARVTESIAITPDVQYVVHPFLNPDLSNALIFYLRTEVAL